MLPPQTTDPYPNPNPNPDPNPNPNLNPTPNQVCSFLNHWVFSHEHLTNRPFASGLVVCLGVFDVSFLDLLSNDEQTDKDVKCVATSTPCLQPHEHPSLRPHASSL